MPFQSEKQRRYLWANEPEIARDWTNTYGHRAQGYDGGVMRVPFQDAGSVLTPEQIKMIKDMKSRGMDTSTIETISGATADQINAVIGDQSNVGGIKPQFASLRTAGDTAAQDVGTYPYYKEQRIEVPDREAIDQYLAKNKLNQGIETIDRSEFIDDANYIPKWNEYTVDPEYDEEEGEDYPVGKQISPFKQWSRNFWANPGQRIMQGINMAFNPFGPIATAATGYALQGG